MEWTEEKIIEYINQGWTLSYDKTNQKYKLQKRINGRVKSYTLPKRFNEFCKRLKEEFKYLPIFEDIEKEYSITKVMERHNLDEIEIYDVLWKYVEWKLNKREGLKELLYDILCKFKAIEEIEDRLNKASRMVRTGFGFAELSFQCPNCLENSKLRYDKSMGKWVCSNCGEIPF
ncbi:hypothetical protein [Archaeoglobus profundus]|nr:hypothetical protein [Archaeoglobus profundus]